MIKLPVEIARTLKHNSLVIVSKTLRGVALEDSLNVYFDSEFTVKMYARSNDAPIYVVVFNSRVHPKQAQAYLDRIGNIEGVFIV